MRPYMVRLRELTRETVTFGMLVNGRPTGVCREEGSNLVCVMGYVGDERPVYAGGIGMLLAAYMNEGEVCR